MLRRQRLKEREEDSRKEMRQLFLTKSLEEITDMIEESEKVRQKKGRTSQEDSDDDEPSVNVDHANEPEVPGDVPQERKKRKYAKADHGDDPLPSKFQCLRESERIVKDKLYYTCANLAGRGFSIPESADAIVMVGNGMFERSWKSNSEDKDVIDNNTMPTNKNIREKLSLIETQSLSLVADEVLQQSEDGRMITHAIDSTTKRRVGTFATQGIHIGQDIPFPLPLCGIVGESTVDVALQIDFGFEIVAATRGISVEELYKTVDCHMTDSTEHNKGINELLRELYNLDKSAGQIFCGTHTTLGFSREMNRITSMIEKDMKLTEILAHFMVDIAPDTKHDSIAGQALDMSLKFVAPEFDSKMWNYHKHFVDFLLKNDIENILFAYKDKRFGCLSRAAAVLLFYWDWICLFLQENPQVSNRLACLVRDLMDLPYLKVIFAVFAGIGVHLVEPFYWKTVEKGATHSILKIFYKGLYHDMETPVEINFFEFNAPSFASVSKNMFKSVKESYGTDVLDMVTKIAHEHSGDVVKLANLMIPGLRTVLARQRRDYGISDEFPAQYPIDEQAAEIDDTPVHDLAMDSQCATVDHRLPKLQTLSAVGRSMILQGTMKLRTGTERSFRSFKAEALKKRLLELKWSEKMKKKFGEKTDETRIVAQANERKRLDMLAELKSFGGPFTEAGEVSQYLLSDAPDAIKKKRLKLEVQFARNSSTTLPKQDPLFRIQVTLPNKKRRDKNPQEFGEALMAYLGKRSEVKTMEYKTFEESLTKMCNFDG